MRAAVRQHLKQAVDAHKRAQIAVAHATSQPPRCPACNADQDTYVQGCRACYDRKRRHRRQAEKEAA